jgi:hypothetical protein
MLRRLAEEIAKHTIIDNWPFYVALLALSFIGTTLGSYLKARMAKRGEVAATKADANAILAQLANATATAKSVELSLSRGDWIQRERNALKRTKLEALITSAFAIVSWVHSDSKAAMKGESFDEVCPINEFVMLHTLYFPELKEKAKEVERLYRVAQIYAGPIRLRIFQLGSEANSFLERGEPEFARGSLSNRTQLQQREQPHIVERTTALHAAVEVLAASAHEIMEQLTAPVSHNG